MYKFVLLWTLVWIFSEAGKNYKYKIFTESNADFHNIMIAYLFNYMRVNGTLHILLLWLMNLLIKELGVTSINELGSDVCMCQKQISFLVKRAQGSKEMR